MLRPVECTPVILPYPRQMQLGSGSVNVASFRIISVGRAADKAAEVLAAGLKELKLPVGDGGFEVSLQQDEGLSERLGGEGYELSVRRKGAHIAAAAYQGLYYGVQTLLQLVQLKPNARARLPVLTVADWPLKPMRGIHTYLPARKDLPFFKRFIEWMGRHKLNTMFLEIGGGMEYHKHPEINHAWERFCKQAMEYPGGPEALQDSQWFFKNSTHVELAGGSYLSQQEVRRIARWCAQNGVEIIPEVQSLSHSYYLALAHPDIAEVAEDPWPDTYCPSNPKSYELFFDVLQEVIDVLKPRIVSIGHDEAYLFNFCKRCKGRDAAESYATDITRARDFLAERGVRTAIWGDKLLEIHHSNGVVYGGVERNIIRYGKHFHQPATNRCVDLIPRDVLILDWYWSLSYESATMLAEKGFEMLYGNFHGPRFQNWARWRDNPALLGGETSLWCAADAYSIGRNGCFHNILWGANNLWSDFDPDSDPGRLMDDIATVMRHDRQRLTGKLSVVLAPSKQRQLPIDLTAAAARGMYPGDGPAVDLGLLPRGEQILGGVKFRIAEDREQPAVFPRVDWHRRACPPVRVDSRADALVFLHTTTAARVHAPTYYSSTMGPNLIGRYLVTYEDGRTAEVPLEYGVNIDAWNTHFMVGKGGDQSATIGAYVYAADPVLEAKPGDGPGCAMFMYEWVNPRPDVLIRDVRLIWDGGYTSGVIALVGLTAIAQAK